MSRYYQSVQLYNTSMIEESSFPLGLYLPKRTWSVQLEMCVLVHALELHWIVEDVLSLSIPSLWKTFVELFLVMLVMKQICALLKQPERGDQAGACPRFGEG
jgi:hypothetical protein